MFSDAPQQRVPVQLLVQGLCKIYLGILYVAGFEIVQLGRAQSLLWSVCEPVGQPPDTGLS